MRFLAILFCFFMALSPALAGQDDPRLDQLFQSLSAIEDRQQGEVVETRIWALWLVAGDKVIDAEMNRGIHFMNTGDLPSALESFDKIIALDPDFAEGWNKRATVYYLMGDLKRSVLDIERTVVLEPRHFGAFSGLGLIYMATGDDAAALRAFEKALEIHPLYGNIENQVIKLRKKIKGRET
jgi:Tfp pilus assembly protein PilF